MSRRRRSRSQKKQMLFVAIVVILLMITGLFFGITEWKKMKERSSYTSSDSKDRGKGIYEITYNGDKYSYNNDILSILFIGIDSSEKMEETKEYGGQAIADSIDLLLFDRGNRTIRLVPINRDMQTEIHKYSLSGYDQGTYETRIAYAYSYGNGGEASAKNVITAVSDIFGGIPIDNYIVTNLYTLNTMNEMFGDIEVTVPNDDLAAQYPELTEGATVQLSGQELVDYLHMRDTGVDFSNQGRMERQKSFIDGWVKQVKGMSADDAVTLWNKLSADHEFMQTNITKNNFLKLMEYTHEYDYDNRPIELSGEYQEINGKDTFFTDSKEREEKKVEIFYEKNSF